MKDEKNQIQDNRMRRSLWSGVALVSVVSTLCFVTMIQCGPSKAQISAGSFDHPTEDSDDVNSVLFEGVEVYQGSAEEPKFSRQSGFEKLLADLNAKFPNGALPVPSMPMQTEIDPQFCVGLAYGECFTFIVQVPSANLQVSPGLSTLNLAQGAPTYAGLFEKACHEGLSLGVKELAKQGFGMNRVLGAVIKSRCIFQTLSDELTPLPKLASNDMAIKVRFVEFDLLGKSSSTAPAFGKVSFENAKIDLKFHDAKVFASGKWQPIKGALNLWNMWNYAGVFGTAHAGISFNQELSFVFNAEGTAAYLSHVLAPILDAARQGEGLGQLGSEILVIKQAVAALAAGSNPVVPTLILIGVAADALRDLCEHEKSNCQIQNQERSVRDAFLQKVGEGSVVPSETRATLLDGMKHVPYAVLKGVFSNANVGEMEKILGLPTRPFWISM